MSQPRTLTTVRSAALFDRLPGLAPRRDLMGIRYMSDTSTGGEGAGAAGAEGGTGTGGTPSPADVAAAAAAGAAAVVNPPAPIGQTPIDTLPQDVQDYIKRLRGENADNRTAAQKANDALTSAQQTEQQRIDAILVAAGMKPEGKTPEQIAAELQQQQQAAQTATTERDTYGRQLALARVAALPQNLVNVDRLLDSRSFTDKLSKVDPTDTAGLQALITEQVTTDPSLRITPVAGGSGGHQHGGAGTGKQRPSLEDAVSARLDSQRPTR